MEKLSKQNNNAKHHLLTHDQGSILEGFILGFFLNVIGVIIAYFLKKPKTKKGALIGQEVQMVILLICSILIVLVLMDIFQGIGNLRPPSSINFF